MARLTETRDRLDEMVCSLSLITDLGLGQPLEHALRSTVVAVRLGDSLGLGDADLADAYFLTLLRFVDEIIAEGGQGCPEAFLSGHPSRRVPRHPGHREILRNAGDANSTDRGRQAAEAWAMPDMLGLLQQLGALPEQAAL